MSDDQRPIIIKKKKVYAAGHHGGAWKVAYADFVTAMMAFFLLMWLLNATTEEQRSGIAEYFRPDIPISPTGGGGDSFLNGDEVTDTEDKAHSAQAELEHIEQAIAATLDGLETEIGEGLMEHISMTVTEEGLRIELMDLAGEPLFRPGSSEPTIMMRALSAMFGPLLGELRNRVGISGHTDAAPLDRNGYTNWELSSDRANTARRLFKDAGMAPSQFIEVVGRAETEPLVADPFAAKNRRISVLLFRPAQFGLVSHDDVERARSNAE